MEKKISWDKRNYENFQDIVPGDYIYTQCMSGLGSGGALYDIGDLVTHCDDEFITTEVPPQRWYKSTGKAEGPLRYYIEYWVKAIDMNS